MGSQTQKNLANWMESKLNSYGLKTFQQVFYPITVLSALEKKPSFAQQKKIVGRNIIGLKEGPLPCTLIFAGHYDTKYFSQFSFVGANDGGSSTALLLELARVSNSSSFSENSMGRCSLLFVFFDGEEAYLQEWQEGSFQYGIQDNLYGSRAFVQKFIKNGFDLISRKKISLATIIDMVGHKDQKLFLTLGSDEKYSNLFLTYAKKISLQKTPLQIEDDHIPFKFNHIPFLHIIDWVDLKEWHTKKDTLKIISLDKIEILGNTILNFLDHTYQP